MAKTGGFGSYQKILLLKTLPFGLFLVFGTSSIAYVTPAVVCEFKISKYEQGLIYSAVYAGMILSGPFWGAVADTLGRRRVLIITGSITGLFEFMSGFSISYWQLFLCKFFVGCGLSGLHLTYYVYLNEFVDPKTKEIMTVISGGASAFGNIILPVMATLLLPLTFEFVIIKNYLFFNSWKILLVLCSCFPLLGTIIAIFLLPESPNYLLLQGQGVQALQILRKIYAKNLNMSEESFPVQNLILENEESINGTIKNYSNFFSHFVMRVKSLFKYPYVIPALMVFLGQFITMISYNSVRQHQPILFALVFGIGQYRPITNSTVDKKNSQFCVLFQTQYVFIKNVTCDQVDIKLESGIFLFSVVVGFSIFVSFFLFRIVVARFGKVRVFLVAHITSAVVISVFPDSVAFLSLIILCIHSACMQNCIILSLGLMISRVPTRLRGLTVSLIMEVGRIGVICGNQILPIISNLSCHIGFWSIAFLNLRKSQFLNKCRIYKHFNTLYKYKLSILQRDAYLFVLFHREYFKIIVAVFLLFLLTVAIPVIFVYSKQPNPFEDALLRNSIRQNRN